MNLHGGQLTKELDENFVTHVITLQNLDLPNYRGRIVHPDWVSDCVLVNRRLMEDYYPSSGKIDNVITSETKSDFKNCFQGAIIYISESFDVTECQKVLEWLQFCGASPVKEYSEQVSHCIFACQEDSLFSRAVQDNKIVASMYWLNYIVLEGNYVPPTNSILFYPRPTKRLNELVDKEISVTGYVGLQRNYLKHLITAMGAKFAGGLNTQTDYVICLKTDSVKYVKAIEWKIPVINHLWLEDVFKEWRVIPLTLSKYKEFLTPLHDAVGQTPVLYLIHSKPTFNPLDEVNGEVSSEICSSPILSQYDGRSFEKGIEKEIEGILLPEHTSEHSEMKMIGMDNDFEKHNSECVADLKTSNQIENNVKIVDNKLMIHKEDMVDVEMGENKENMNVNAIKDGSEGKEKTIQKNSTQKVIKERKEEKVVRKRKPREPKALPGRQKLKVMEPLESVTSSPMRSMILNLRSERDAPQTPTKSLAIRSLSTPIKTPQVLVKSKLRTMHDEVEEVTLTPRRKTPIRLERVPFRILFTGEKITPKLTKEVQALHGAIVQNVVDCTHLVSSKLFRSEKFLIAVSHGKPIMSLEWLNQSSKKGEFLSP
jgi:hypothetical protein